MIHAPPDPPTPQPAPRKRRVEIDRLRELIGALEDEIVDKGVELEELAEQIAKYETAFAGMWVALDGNGDLAVWQNPEYPTYVLRLFQATSDFQKALIAVLPTEPPTQGAES